jgi:hypothetical protein
MSRPTPAGTEVRRARATTWIALVVITAGTAAAFFFDARANPVAQGLLAVLATLEIMIALWWWRSTRRRGR